MMTGRCLNNMILYMKILWHLGVKPDDFLRNLRLRKTERELAPKTWRRKWGFEAVLKKSPVVNFQQLRIMTSFPGKELRPQ